MVVFGIIGLVVLYLVLRFYGRRDDRMLEQYEILEKRFQLERKTYRNKWGGEFHHNLKGNYRGYPISLYNHFHGRWPSKQEWTSLSMEVLFAGELQCVLNFSKGDDLARFDVSHGLDAMDISASVDGLEIWSNQREPWEGWSERLLERFQKTMSALAGEKAGSFRLSKGFLEYRESGLITEAPKRQRFQEALLFMGEIIDHVSIVLGQSKDQ